MSKKLIGLLVLWLWSWNGGAEASELTALYLGDVQSGFAEWQEMVYEAVQANPDLQLVLLGGDLVEQGTNSAEWKQVAQGLPDLPLYAARGNHDDLTYFRDFFSLPENSPPGFAELFYSWEQGAVHFTVLDSNSLGDPSNFSYDLLAKWLQEDLAATAKPWKIVLLHHPPYPLYAESKSNILQEFWVPILEEGGVNLVLCGHQHNYAKTHSLRGITYIMGNSGGILKESAVSWPYLAQVYGESSNYQIIRAEEKTLELFSYNAAGSEIDHIKWLK